MEDQSSFVVGAVLIQWTLISTSDAFRKKDVTGDGISQS